MILREPEADARRAATSPEEHDNAIAYDFPMFSKPTTSEEFVHELS